MNKKSFPQGLSIARRALLATAAAALFAPALHAQGIAPEAMAQIETLLAEKASRGPVQQKLASQLVHAQLAASGRMGSNGTVNDVYLNALQTLQVSPDGLVDIDVHARVTRGVLGQIAALGGSVVYASAREQQVRARLPLAAVEALAALAEVRTIEPAARATTNIGAVTSQAYISHKAREVINSAPGRDGTGVRVGVLSDSAQSVPNLIVTGDLRPSALIVPGQGGPATGSSEGSAMMEIVQDLAPGAQVIFATAFTSVASFADNIRLLRNVYNCDIIVDDVSYFNEGVFQDGPIARAVNDVTASGALYFSSAGNSGNVTSGTAGAWEGDFVAGSASAAPLAGGYTLHRFTGTQEFNTLTAAGTLVTFKWADPLAASTNDYDLFLLNSTGTAVVCASTNIQSGTQDPYEFCGTAAANVGNRIVIAKKTGAADRALHLNTNRGRLSTATTGVVYGHNAGANTVSTAATFWNSGRGGVRPFVGGANNPTETFSSDGPRKIFFQPNGTPITAGNFLFGTNGGTTLAKPDLTAADGVSTKTPGFAQFYGTSAAAPHAAAIAALVKSVRPDYTNVQILTALRQSALDIRAPGPDVDSGVGIIMAWEAVNYALSN